MKTQMEQVKSHLLKHKRITSWEAIMNYQITRLSHYIYALKRQGLVIMDKRVYPIGKNWYTIYYID